MTFNIRLEAEGDHRAVEFLTREAFWNLHVPGCDEHLVAFQLRKSGAFLPSLDFVAECGGAVVGNIMVSLARAVGEQGRTHTVPIIGPLSVDPKWQRRGVGSALMRRALSSLWEQGYGAVVLYGSPGYYHRFGFGPAEKFGIRTPDGRYIAALMAMELVPGGLSGVTGRLYEDEAFHCEEAALQAFDAQFPQKEKRVTETQSAFRAMADENKR